MLTQAKCKDHANGVNWIEGDVTHLPLSDATFDCVICANGFHYFHRPQDAILEMRRVLRPGGRLVIVDWCDDYLVCKICSWWLRLTNQAFHRTYTLPACISLAESVSVEVECHSRFRIGWLWGLMSVSGHRTK